MCYNTLRAGIVSSRERKTLPYLRHKRLGFMRNFKLRELKSHSLWGRQTLIFQRVIPSETLIHWELRGSLSLLCVISSEFRLKLLTF